LRLLPRILADEADEDAALDRAEEDQTNAGPAETRAPPLHWGWTAALAAAAATPRLLYLFVFSDPENPGAYGDVWHHWQIAYLTKEIGLGAANGPRLWDLKGLDYIWGILHPLLMVAVFAITGSIDIVLTRLVSLACGVLAVVLLFHLCRRYWDNAVAWGVALFAVLLPTSVMNDASGMVEPLGVVLCLLGLWSWPRRGGLWSGLWWGLATMARAEAWLFGLGLVVASLLRRPGRSVPLVAGFAAVVLLYMKVLLDQTGNPIYPLWWNFFATAVGDWQPATISAAQESARPVLIALFLVSLIGLGWSLWRRPRSYQLLTFGFGYWVFVAGMFGLTAYLSTWVWWLPVSRRFEFPVLFAALLLVVGLLHWAPSRFGRNAKVFGWVVVAVTVIGAQMLWVPIAQVFGPTEATWQTTLSESRQLGAWYNQAPYNGHSLAVPSDRPDITYALARFGGVEGKHLVSQMYDPFAYLPSGYTYADHQATVNTLLACWLSQTDTRLIAIPQGDANYELMLQNNPTWFTTIGTMPAAGWTIEGVSAPPPTTKSCEAARSASQ
jgi:hypothetical protein